jgi:phosphoethanolamine N-methyltransferase
MTEHALYYTDALLEKLQLRWGDGFLSPGGEGELERMLSGVSVDGHKVLDLGCGVGGYDMLLVAAHGAGKVVGVDIDAASLEIARRRTSSAGVGERVEFRRVSPGPLPFDDATFDIVFSKDIIVDLPDKRSAVDELFRVLQPGGSIVLSDWFRGERPMTTEMREWTGEGDETYEMATLTETADVLSRSGFTDIVTEDRNAWFRSMRGGNTSVSRAAVRNIRRAVRSRRCGAIRRERACPGPAG